MSAKLRLGGLDAQNPLAFFAALGLLRVLDDASSAGARRPRLWFEDEGGHIAHLDVEMSYDEVCGVVLDDAKSARGSAALNLAYDEDGRRVDPAEKNAIRDLKPPPQLCREFLQEMRGADRRSADLGAAFFSELIQDRTQGNTKPTALHFTAGQQEFLRMVDIVRRELSREQLDEALLGPWRGDTPLPSLSWNATVSRMYALRASDPSKEKRGSVPAANWLAVIGLTFFPVNAGGDRLLTAGVVGGWKDGRFRWPVWRVPASRSAVASLLRADVTHLRAHERDALGISQIFQAGISRSDQGGYGTFTPPSVLPPGSR